MTVTVNLTVAMTIGMIITVAVGLMVTVTVNVKTMITVKLAVIMTVSLKIYHGTVCLTAWSTMPVKFMVTVGVAATVIMHCRALSVTMTMTMPDGESGHCILAEDVSGTLGRNT